MKESNSFIIIKKLSMSEKRQFKIFSNRHIIQETNKYIVLFDHLEKMKEYDETLLEQLLTAENYDVSYLKADQNYLYQLILRSLIIFNSGKSGLISIKEYLLIIEILFKKDLFNQCKKEIEKAKKLAISIENNELLLDIFHWDRKLIYYNNYNPKDEIQLLNRMIAIEAKIKKELDYLLLYAKTNELRIEIAKTRKKEDIKLLKDLFENEMLQQPLFDLPLNAKIKYLQAHAMYHFILGNKQNELNCNCEIIELLEKNKLFLNEYPNEFINTKSRIISILKDIDHQLFKSELAALRLFQPNQLDIGYNHHLAQIYNFSYMTEFSFYLNSKQFELAKELIIPIEEGLKTYQKELKASFKITFLYMLSYLQFIIGDYDQARKKINIILNDYDENNRPELYNLSKLLNLLIHLELENFGYIKYKQSNVAYYFKKQSASFKTEKTVLSFFSKPKNYQENLIEKLLELESELIKMEKNSLEKEVFKYFDFLLWIKSKIQKTTMLKASKILD